MRSEVIGKTMAIIMVMAMIATGIATLIPNAAAGDPQITGTVLSSVAPYSPISGAYVNYTGASGATPKTTTDSQGKFTLYVYNVTKEDFTLTFQKDGFQDTTRNFLSTSYVGDLCATNTTTMKPVPTVSGTVKETGTGTAIPGVTVNIIDKTGGGWKITKYTQTGTDGKFSCKVSGVTNIDLYYKKIGYYSVIDENVDITDGKNVGEVFLEKIVPTPTIKVSGVIFDNVTKDTIAGALVSISEGNDKWITALSNEEGKYEMYAYPSNFQIKCSKTGYFTKTDAEWLNVPIDETTVRRDMWLDPTPTPEDQTVSGIVSDVGGPLGNVTVNLYSNDGRYMKTNNTWWDGSYSISFYQPGTFTLEVKKDGYYTDASVTNITKSWNPLPFTLIKIGKNFNLRGYVVNLESNDFIEGATVKIFDKNLTRLYTNSTTTDANGYYVFNVSTGSSFAVLVDAAGCQSKLVSADAIVKNRYLEIGLYPSDTDKMTTTYTFLDWNNIMATKNSIITVDNVSVRFEADRRFGMGDIGLINNDCDLSTGEISDWAAYLRGKGIEKGNTKEFLTLNNSYYLLNTTSYSVTIEGADGPVSQDATIFINSTYNYTIHGALENINSTVFTLGFNATYDTEFVDNVNQIYLPTTPKKYEVTSNITETNKVEVLGYGSPVTIDPMVFDGDVEKVTMTVQLSQNGTAKAKLVSGIHYVMNSTYDNYTVIVAQGPSAGDDTTVKFSAEESTDKIGDIAKANYTWDFGDGSKGYGIKVEHNFTSVDGEVQVKLVITETGGNHTYRNITVFVDSQNPLAAISAVVTDSDNVSYAPSVLTVNEDLAVTFSGVKFTDVEDGMGSEIVVGTASSDAITSGDGGKGIIEKWYWSWGEEESSDETITKDGSNNITHAYATPGQYTLNMIATDVASRESANATWTVNVLDITAPIAAFTIKDSSGAIVSETIENKTFTYNASSTTDNYDDTENLTFEWSFDIDGTYHNDTGMSVNYTFTYVGTFNVTIKVTDKAGNYLNKTTPVHVNLAERPNILMKLGSMVFTSSSGTVGKAMTISVNITNDGTANASDIQTTFYIRNSDDTDRTIGTASTSFLGIGNTTTVSITWTPGKKGEYSIWANSTCSGEHSSQWWDNKIDDFNVQKVNVKEAPWVMPAIIIGIVVVIIVVFLGMRYFMRTGTEAEETSEKRKKR